LLSSSQSFSSGSTLNLSLESLDALLIRKSRGIGRFVCGDKILESRHLESQEVMELINSRGILLVLKSAESGGLDFRVDQ